MLALHPYLSGTNIQFTNKRSLNHKKLKLCTFSTANVLFSSPRNVCMFSPRRDCSVPSSVDAMSLSLSKPRPLSIHDWAVFSNTYNLHCIWSKIVTTNKNFTAFCHISLLRVFHDESLPSTCKTLLSDSSPVLTSTFSKMHFLAVALV